MCTYMDIAWINLSRQAGRHWKDSFVYFVENVHACDLS